LQTAKAAHKSEVFEPFFAKKDSKTYKRNRLLEIGIVDGAMRDIDIARLLGHTSKQKRRHKRRVFTERVT
jgi:hypothetical protein